MALRHVTSAPQALNHLLVEGRELPEGEGSGSALISPRGVNQEEGESHLEHSFPPMQIITEVSPFLLTLLSPSQRPPPFAVLLRFTWKPTGKPDPLWWEAGAGVSTEM